MITILTVLLFVSITEAKDCREYKVQYYWKSYWKTSKKLPAGYFYFNDKVYLDGEEVSSIYVNGKEVVAVYDAGVLKYEK